MVRDLVLAAATRRQIPVRIVGNSHVNISREHGVAASGGKLLIETIVVRGGFDAADDRIVELCGGGDLVITADVPLAARIVAKGAIGLSPRGEEFDPRSIGDQLSTRNLMQELRGGGMLPGGGGGPPPLGPADKKRFADALDRLLARLAKGR